MNTNIIARDFMCLDANDKTHIISLKNGALNFFVIYA
jgi:hypothetical protein